MTSPPVRRGRVLDRIEHKDERSRAFGVARHVAEVPGRGRAWTPGRQLDQGRTGHCGGFSGAAEAGASPVRVRGITDDYAHGFYYEIKDRGLDPFGREDGTSTLAVMRLGVLRGLWASYSWAFSVDDVKRALAVGPVVLGIPWWDSMFEPDGENVIRPVGDVPDEGHLLIIRRWTTDYRGPGLARLGPAFLLRNSWGGQVNSWLLEDGLHRVLVEGRGEAGVPVDREVPPVAPLG